MNYHSKRSPVSQLRRVCSAPWPFYTDSFHAVVTEKTAKELNVCGFFK